MRLSIFATLALVIALAGVARANDSQCAPRDTACKSCQHDCTVQKTACNTFCAKQENKPQCQHDCDTQEDACEKACVTPESVNTTTTTLPPVFNDCAQDSDCTEHEKCDEGKCVALDCPEPPACPPVQVTCKVDVCTDGACTNGSSGTDGTGKCSKDTDCQIVTVTDSTTTNNVFNVTVNRCAAQEDMVICRRTNAGGMICPSYGFHRWELVPFSRAAQFPHGKHRSPGAKLPNTPASIPAPKP